MYKKSSILDIPNIKTRNVLRSLSKNPSEDELMHAYDVVRSINSPGQIFNITEVSLSQPIRKHFTRDYYFPETINRLFNRKRFEFIGTEVELGYQCAHLNHNYKDIVEAFSCLHTINVNIVTKKDDEAFKNICSFISSYGFSRTILAKLAFFHANARGNSAVNSYVTQFVEQPATLGTVAHYFQIFEMLDDDYLIGTIRRWVERISKLTDTVSCEQYLHNFWPTTFCDETFGNRLGILGGTSVIDSAVFIFQHMFPHYPAEITDYNNATTGQVCTELTNKYVELFVNTDAEMLQKFEDNKTSNSWASAYKLASVLHEYPTINRFKASVDLPLTTRFRELYNLTDQKTADLRDSFFSSALSLKNLGKASNPRLLQIGRFENHQADSFIKTMATIECLRKGESLSSLDDTDVRILLDGTEELAHLLTFDEISDLHKVSKSENQLVIACLTTCLLFQSDPTDERDFNFRMDLQEAILSWFHGDIIQFLDWLFKRTPKIAQVIGEVCDLSLIQKLYLLYSDYDSAFEARREILNWLGVKFDNPDYTEASNRLKTDKKIRKIKGAIDDAKIFVDELKFGQWLSSEVGTDLRRFSRSIDITTEHPTTPSQQVQTNTDFGENFWVFRSCQDAFSEFCLNPMYGISSYLSRRIRHGTLDGFLITPVKRLFQNPEFSSLFESDSFTKVAETWLSDYIEFVDCLRRDYLHFQSDAHPKGFFKSDLGASQVSLKHTKNFIGSIRQHLQSGLSPDLVVLLYPKFCWQCVETDLIKTQRYISEWVAKEGVPSISNSFSIAVENTELIRKFRNGLTRLLSSRYQEFSGWFTKPEAVSLSVSIRELSNVVLGDVMDFDELNEFHPDVKFEGTVDDTLHGHVYHILNDCLFILFGNVAKWGNPEGKLLIFAERIENSNFDAIRISVSSDYSNNGDKESTNRNIRAKMSVKNTTELMTKDTGSGLGKLRSIISELPDDYNLTYLLDEMITFSIEIPIVWVQS